MFQQVRTTIFALIAAGGLIASIASCGSDAPEAAPFEPLAVTTQIAQSEFGPSYIDERLSVFWDSGLDVGARVSVTVEENNTVIDSTSAEVVSGDIVELAGWTVHFERVGTGSVHYWAIDPDGVQHYGDPRN